MRATIITQKRARKLRREMTLPEVILWDCLQGRRSGGLRFRRQHAIGPYVLDFYCASARLAVEVDGAVHDLEEQMVHDRRRDGWLAERGIRTFRIAAADVLNEQSLEGVLRSIVELTDPP